jgi:hypothetical protein
MQNRTLVTPHISGAHGGAVHVPSHAKAPRWSSANRVVVVHELPSHVNTALRFDAAPLAEAILAQPRKASGRDETTVRCHESSSVYDQILTLTPNSAWLGLLPDASLADVTPWESSPKSTHEHGTGSFEACETPEIGITWEDYCSFSLAAPYAQTTTASGTTTNST